MQDQSTNATLSWTNQILNTEIYGCKCKKRSLKVRIT